MNRSALALNCRACGEVIKSVDWLHVDRVKESSKDITCPPCPRCGAVITGPDQAGSVTARLGQSGEAISEIAARHNKALAMTDGGEAKQSPSNEPEMRDAIIAVLKNLYPTRTGYNGGHLAPVRDPNPDLFFAVLHELEQEGIIEYNDTQIAMRLSDKFLKENEVAV